MSTELFRVGSIDELVAHRDRALDLIASAVSMLLEAEREAKKAAGRLLDGRAWDQYPDGIGRAKA
jgi:protein gp37